MVKYQKEVNEVRDERIAKNANPLTLVADASPYPIAKPITPPSESASKEDSDLEQAKRDKDMKKNLSLIAKKPKRVKDSTYHKEKMLLCKQAEKGVPLQAEQSDWLVDTDEEIDEQELEPHYSLYWQDPRGNPKIVCLISLSKQTELETYKTLNDRTVDYDKLERKLNETLGLLAQKEIDIKEGLKLKAYEISVVKEKHDELVKQSFLTKSHYEGLVKEKTKVITDLKLKEEKDIDKMISMEKQLKFLNEIVYKRNQSIQTIHMLAPKGPTFNGRPTFANPMYLKKAQSKKPCLYEIPYDTSDPANRFVPDREETLTLEKESRSKLNKDLVKPYDYTKQNSLYENFKPASQEYHEQLAHANEFCKEKASNVFLKECEQYFKIQDLKAQLQDKNIAISELKKLIEKCKGKSVETKFDKPSVVQQPNAQRIPKLSVLGKPTPFSDSLQRKRVIHITNVSRPQLRSTQIKDKVVPNNSQVQFKKTEVEDHHKISSISNKTKFVTACNDSLKYKTSNVNAVYATCGKCVFNSNHDACVSKFIHHVNARTKKPKVASISTRKPKSHANKSVATPPKKIVALESTI
ncbi:hypothetical protein Tco_1282964 [Tanacetum coccineum]